MALTCGSMVTVTFSLPLRPHLSVTRMSSVYVPGSSVSFTTISKQRAEDKT